MTETLGALSRVDPDVAIYVYDEEGSLVGASHGARPTAATRSAETRARASAEPILELTPAHDPQPLRLALRLRDETPDSASAIVLEKPLHELQRDLASSRRTTWLTMLLFVLTVALVAWVLTRRYLGAPLSRMIAGMQRVRSGDLHIEREPHRRDEVGEAQRQFELLVRDLEAARERADQEFEARRRMERGLEQADKLITLGQLSAVMAHEIGSPLQILEGRARALEKHGEDPEATRRTARLLVEQTERITRIVGQMLSITRRKPALRTQVDAEDAVRKVLALLELEARRRQVQMRLERTGDSRVFADGDQLQQVVLNLLRNALEASPRDGAIEVVLRGDVQVLTLTVHDAGPGIDPAIRPHLFEPFFTTKTASGGSGLGLCVVQSIVREHGGTVEFLPPDAAGCTVQVRLPRTAEESVS